MELGMEETPLLSYEYSLFEWNMDFYPDLY